MIFCGKRIYRLFFILSFLFAALYVFAQPSEAMKLSESLYKNMQAQGFSPQKHFLYGDDGTNFPYSVEIHFAAADTTEETLLFAIPQEMLSTKNDGLEAFLQNLKDASLPINVSVLLQADEFSMLPPVLTDGIAYGTQAFLQEVTDTNSLAVVLLGPLPSGGNAQAKVVFGADGNMTPQWLVKQLPLSLPQSSILTYRLNLSLPDTRLSAFLDAGIAAVLVQFDQGDAIQTDAVYKAMDHMARTFSVQDRQRMNSSNYLFFSLPNSQRVIWIGEKIFVLVYLAAAAIVIFVASGFSLFNKNKQDKQLEFAKTWYLIPITILLSTLSLVVGQLVAERIAGLSGYTPVMVLSVKTFFSFLFVSLMFIILVKLNLPMSQMVYGFLLSLVSVLNIFIFTSIDLVLLVVFLFEYIIIYITRVVRRTVPLFITTLIMLVPFIPYAINIWEYATPQKLMSLVQTGFWGNMIYACILVPFQIMWLRILVRMNVFGRNKNISSAKIYGTAIAMLVGMLVILTGCFMTISIMFKHMGFPSVETGETLARPPLSVSDEVPDDNLPLQFTARQSPYLDLRFVEFTVRSSLPILKYNVSVGARSVVPVYDSHVPFDITQGNDGYQALFRLPYNPAYTTSISYTATGTETQTLTATVYIQASEDTIVRATRTVELPALLADRGMN